MQAIRRDSAVHVLASGLVSRKDAAAYLGRQPSTLAIWATQGRGPKHIRVGGLAYYQFADLERFAAGDGVEPATASAAPTVVQ